MRRQQSGDLELHPGRLTSSRPLGELIHPVSRETELMTPTRQAAGGAPRPGADPARPGGAETRGSRCGRRGRRARVLARVLARLAAARGAGARVRGPGGRLPARVRERPVAGGKAEPAGKPKLRAKRVSAASGAAGAARGRGAGAGALGWAGASLGPGRGRGERPRALARPRPRRRRAGLFAELGNRSRGALRTENHFFFLFPRRISVRANDAFPRPGWRGGGGSSGKQRSCGIGQHRAVGGLDFPGGSQALAKILRSPRLRRLPRRGLGPPPRCSAAPPCPPRPLSTLQLPRGQVRTGRSLLGRCQELTVSSEIRHRAPGDLCWGSAKDMPAPEPLHAHFFFLESSSPRCLHGSFFRFTL
ncbi:translation initiation factor IF-2-like [Vulpes lagopus]|uniref:translation initiation factor IF-2-like n=1 Tax=Vulpes lagopus TaxID=494514 RepID=UPI001BCA3952|nr:translation initiation factor IF-2-like [Vulpes lagopus]